MGEGKASIREQLDADRRAFLDAVAALSAGDLGRTVWPGNDWTARDLIGHVAYAEGSMIPLIRGGLGGEVRQPPPDFDIDRWNESRLRRARGQSVGELLARLAESRAELLALLGGLSDADLDRPAHHTTQGPTTVAGIFRIIAGHERQHAGDLRALSA